MTGSKLQEEIMEYLRKAGYLVWKNHNYSKRGRTLGYLKGLPDIFAIKHGRFFAIEVKGAGDKPSIDQINWIQKMLGAGAIAFVAKSLKDVRAMGL